MQNIKESDSISTEKFRIDYQKPAYLIEKIDLKFEMFDDKTIVTNKMLVTKNDEYTKDACKAGLVLNGEDLKLIDIRLTGISLPRSSYKLDTKTLEITELPFRCTIEIVTEIYPDKNSSLEGLYISSGKYCTQCEAEGFRKITFYQDRPDVMAIFTTRLEADKSLYPYLLSNGNLIESGDLDEGRHYATWLDPFPKPCYLFALVAGDFDLLEDTYVTSSGRDVALKIYVEEGKLNQCNHAMSSLKKAMKWDEDVYGLEYDLDIYMIVAVSDFNMGAMENKGLNVFNTRYVLANNKTATDADFEGVEGVIGHEYFHNWTGNRVTCRDWFQLSLKEGLTVFRDQEFSSDMNSRAVKRIEDVQVIKNIQFAEDSGPMAHPIRPDSYIEMNNFYTVTVYNKGAEVIRMFETLLGKEGFKKGIKHYFDKHDGQAVTCEDFIRSMESANSTDLTLFRNWYSQAGTPIVDVSSHWNENNATYVLTFKQHCKATPNQTYKEPFLIPMKVALFSSSGERLKLSLDSTKQNLNYSISASGKEVTLHLTGTEQKVEFTGIEYQPTPSLLRAFSAPVKLTYDYSIEQLANLLTYDNDSYTQWEAGQLLMIASIKKVIDTLSNNYGDTSLSTTIIKAYTSLLNSILDTPTGESIDSDVPSLVALSLAVPSLEFFIEQFDLVPFDELIKAHSIFQQSLATGLRRKLILCYEKSRKESLKKELGASSWRRLQNACLKLLAANYDQSIDELAIQQFNEADNMTTSLAALKVLVHSSSEHKHSILETFYHRWQGEALVIDKWLTVQATIEDDCVFELIEQLMEDADFEYTNPNKVRALVSAFARNNLKSFHHSSGKGYELVGDVIVKLNKINPQIAARLTSAYNQCRKFDSNRKNLMKKQLQRFVELENVSPDVFEIATKALTEI